jgi:hypothetical protein
VLSVALLRTGRMHLANLRDAVMTSRFFESVRSLTKDAPTTNRERRQSARHACDDGSIRVMVFLGPEPCAATLQDISVGGIAVLVDAILAPGDRLNVEVHNAAKGICRCKVLHVVHAAPSQSGRWLIGGAFSQSLSAEELRSLLPLGRMTPFTP